MTLALPLEAQRLLRERIGTPEALEVLLTMHATPSKAWDAQDLAERMRREVGVCRAALEHLANSQLVRRVPTVPEGYEYAPVDDESARATDQLARSYAADRLAILRWMNASAIDRLRAAARKLFGAS